MKLKVIATKEIILQKPKGFGSNCPYFFENFHGQTARAIYTKNEINNEKFINAHLDYTNSIVSGMEIDPKNYMSISHLILKNFNGTYFVTGIVTEIAYRRKGLAEKCVELAKERFGLNWRVAVVTIGDADGFPLIDDGEDFCLRMLKKEIIPESMFVLPKDLPREMIFRNTDKIGFIETIYEYGWVPTLALPGACAPEKLEDAILQARQQNESESEIKYLVQPPAAGNDVFEKMLEKYWDKESIIDNINPDGTLSQKMLKAYDDYVNESDTEENESISDDTSSDEEDDNDHNTASKRKRENDDSENPEAKKRKLSY
jgi:hypothetical protein